MLLFKCKVVNDQNYSVIERVDKTPQKGDSFFINTLTAVSHIKIYIGQKHQTKAVKGL